MCKHILNAQVAVRAPCCKKWYDCPQCHAETQDHRLAKTTEITMICKVCKKAFRKDLAEVEEADEYCPHCDNHYVIRAQTAGPAAQALAAAEEGEDVRMDRRTIIDERTKFDPKRDFYDKEYEAQATERIDRGGVLQALRDTGAVPGGAAASAAAAGAAGEEGSKGAGHGIMDFDDNDLDWS